MEISYVHHKLSSGEECLFLTITFFVDGLGKLRTRNWQYFRGQLQNPKARDNRNTFWDVVIPESARFDREICHYLYKQNVHKTFPNVAWDQRFVTGAF